MAEDGGGGGGGGYEVGGDFDNTVQELVITGQELCYPIADVVYSSHTYVVLVHSKTTTTKALHNTHVIKQRHHRLSRSQRCSFRHDS